MAGPASGVSLQDKTASSEGTALQAGYSFWYMRRGKNAAGAAATTGTTTASNSSTPTGKGGGDNKSDGEGSGPVHPYEDSIKAIATVRTVEEFWAVYDYLVRPSELPTTTDYHCFREGIKPTWEDPANARGGKWIVRLPKGLASRYWEEVVLALLGGQFTTAPSVADGEVCGAVVSIRYSEDIISLWNRTATDREVTERLRESLRKVLQLPHYVQVEYKPHKASLEDKSSFRNTQVWKPSSGASSTSSNSPPLGAKSGGLLSSSGADLALSGSGGGGEAHHPRSGIRRSGSWGDREDLRKPGKRSEEARSWRS